MELKSIFILCLIFISSNNYGQTEVDTIRFKTVKTKTVNSLDDLDLKIIDTLSNPKGYILTKNEYPETIAIKKGSKYLVFPLLPDSIDGYATHTKRIEINGKNHKELIVYWSNINGRSGIRGGFSDVFKGIIIYDLKKVMQIFDWEYYSSVYQWENDLDEDLEVTSTSEYLECYNYDLRFLNKEIILNLKRSKDCDSIDISNFGSTIWHYKLKNKLFAGSGTHVGSRAMNVTKPN